MDSLTQFKQLIDAQGEKEQRYQKYLETHTNFIPREFIQNHGLHLNLVLRKLPIPGGRISDFFYLSKSSADWNAILVEIEKPHSRYFKNGETTFHSDFLRAMEQVSSWRAVLADQGHRESLRGTIEPLLRPHDMARNQIDWKYVLVHGRRSEFSQSEPRKRAIKAFERDDLKILSYDSLVDGAENHKKAYVGRHRRDAFELLTGEFLGGIDGEKLFAWVDPAHLRVTPQFKADALEQKATWVTRRPQDGSSSFVMETVLPGLAEFDPKEPEP